MHKAPFRLFIFAGIFFILAPTLVLGQSTDELCRRFVDDAFREITNNCTNLADNQACYALGEVGEVISTFYIDGEPLQELEDLFAEAADRIALIEEDEAQTLESLVTEEFFLDRDLDDDNDGIEEEDEVNNIWGVGIQEVRANLPRQLEQNTAVYVVFGGVRIENGVFPEDALMLPEEPLAVETIIDTNTGNNTDISVFSSPTGLGYLVPSTQVDTVNGAVEADGISPDGNWVRIFYLYERELGERATAWVQVADLEENPELSDLPVIGPETYTPMQRLFLTNSFNDPECQSVPPPGILIQGPEAIETDFLINEAQMRLTSTTFVELIAPRLMRVTTLNGFTVLFPDTPAEEIIPAGFQRVLCLTEERDLGIDGQINDRELDLDCPQGPPGQVPGGGLSNFDSVGNLSDAILNYEMLVPSEVCASGVGGPICTIQLPPQALERIQAICDTGRLPEEICLLYGI